VPAWLFVAFFTGWDVYYLLSSDNSSNINFAAHVGGALGGYLLGVLLFRQRKRDIQPYTVVGHDTMGIKVGRDPTTNERVAQHIARQRKKKW